jgi:NAD(P)-dependent dehydrogenase (short-subunit alcohol dehydrogenase family)
MNVGVAGLGLIGGSFAKAAAHAGHRVLAWNRTRETADKAVADGVAADCVALDGVNVFSPERAISPFFTTCQSPDQTPVSPIVAGVSFTQDGFVAPRAGTAAASAAAQIASMYVFFIVFLQKSFIVT